MRSDRDERTSTTWHVGKLKDDGGSNLTEVGVTLTIPDMMVEVQE
jgi:hypothetical protein